MVVSGFLRKRSKTSIGIAPEFCISVVGWGKRTDISAYSRACDNSAMMSDEWYIDSKGTNVNISSWVIVGVALVALFVVALIVALVIRGWIKVARPDEALVISGKKQATGDSNVAVVVNGKSIVNPITQRSEVISLRSRQVQVSARAQSADNITLEVESVALVKISSNPEYVRRAAERFASQDSAIELFTTEQLEGALRGVIAKLSVAQLMKERKEFSEQIATDVAGELAEQGLILDSFQIKNIGDGDGYIVSLGVPQIQEKRQAAEIAEANAEREITKRKLETSEENLIEQTKYDQNVQESNSRVYQAKAKAEQAEELARAQAEQEVLKQEATNKQAKLDADVRRVAEAERYRREQEAQADKYEKVEAATAEKEIAIQQAEALKVEAKQRAESAYVEAEARANSTRAEAEAEAEAIRMKGKAKAEAIEAEARALEQNREVMLAQKALEVLPAVMEQFAKGYSTVGKISIVGGGSETNVSNRLAGENAKAMTSTFETIQNATGIDLKGILQSHTSGRAMGEGFSTGRQNETVVESATVETENTPSEEEENPRKNH